ncbi:MAG: hypothetical protein V1929_05955 [bacterium]
MQGIVIFRIELQGSSFLSAERLADFSFEQGLNHQGHEEYKHVGFNSFDLLEQQ